MLGSPQDLLMLGLVGFLLFGANKMPEMARTFGSSVVEFKKAMRAAVDEPSKKEEGKEAADKEPA